MATFLFHDIPSAIGAEHYLKALRQNEPPFPADEYYTFYRHENEIRYLHAFETPPKGAQLFHLNETQHNEFLDTFGKKAKQIIYSQSEEDAANEGEHFVRKEIDSNITLHDVYLKQIKTQTNASPEEIDDIKKSIEKGLSELRISPREEKVAGLSGLMDAAWMLQTVATNDALKSTGKQALKQLASSQAIGGIFFGVATGLIMGVGCGLTSAAAYYKNAQSEFENKHKRAPNENEKKLIARDARHLGYVVFGSMTGWTIGAGLMQGAFYIAKTVAGLTPHGIIINLAISAASGIGDAITSCITTYHAEKAKYRNADGVLDEAKWKKARTSKDFIISMAKTAITTFVAGFAWNMIGTYLPTPIQHAIKNVGGKVLGVVATAAASGLTSFTTFCAGIGFEKLYKKLKKPDSKDTKNLEMQATNPAAHFFFEKDDLREKNTGKTEKTESNIKPDEKTRLIDDLPHP